MSQRKPHKPSETRSFSDELKENEREWIAKIGNYDIKDDKGILADSAVKNHLYKGCAEKPTTTAREAFIKKLTEVLKNHPKHVEGKPGETVKMEDLLGKDGLQLYKKAIQEEYQSREFREAVLLGSTNHYEGPSWKKKMVLWVTGPSASGKSFARDGLVKVASDQMEKNDDDKGNNVVSVDGGVEREFSQMRQLVLETALSEGYDYKGIEDLEEQTEKDEKGKSIKKIKSSIEKVAEKHEGLHIAIPTTGTNFSFLSGMKKYAGMRNVQQIFCQIVGGKTKKEKARFQRTVERLGNQRAWFRGKFKGKIKINNRNIGCESKKYNKKHFKSGVRCSRIARRIYRLSQALYGKKILDYTVTNDLIFYRKHAVIPNSWVECSPNYEGSPVVQITERGYNAWKKIQTSYPDLDAWWESNKKNPAYTKAIVNNVDGDDNRLVLELASHPFYKKHKDASEQEIAKLASVLLSHLERSYEPGKIPLELRKLKHSMEKIINKYGKSKSINLFILCDTMYQQLVNKKNIGPSIIQSLKEKCGLSSPKATPAIENKGEPVSSRSSMGRIHRIMETKESEKRSETKMGELKKQFDLSVVELSHLAKSDLKKSVEDEKISKMFEIKKGSAEGAIIAEKKEGKNYALYSIKTAEGGHSTEEAYIMLKLFVGEKGSEAPVYIVEEDSQFKTSLLVVGFANGLDLRDKYGKKIVLDENVSQFVQSFKENYSTLLDLGAPKPEPDKISDPVGIWLAKVNVEVSLDKLNSLVSLGNTQASLENDKAMGEALLSNQDLSRLDKELISNRLGYIKVTLDAVQEKMKHHSNSRTGRLFTPFSGLFKPKDETFLEKFSRYLNLTKNDGHKKILQRNLLEGIEKDEKGSIKLHTGSMDRVFDNLQKQELPNILLSAERKSLHVLVEETSVTPYARGQKKSPTDQAVENKLTPIIMAMTQRAEKEIVMENGMLSPDVMNFLDKQSPGFSDRYQKLSPSDQEKVKHSLIFSLVHAGVISLIGDYPKKGETLTTSAQLDQQQKLTNLISATIPIIHQGIESIHQEKNKKTRHSEVELTRFGS